MIMFFTLLMSLAHADNCSQVYHDSLAALLNDKQYPEDRTYTSSDRGFRQYQAPSVHGTGKFALTFDDGPHEVHTDKILDVLQEGGVKATFFVISSRINAKTRPVLERALKDGHILACHGVEHLNSNDITKDKFKANVKNCFLEIRDIYLSAGVDFKNIYYRYPYAAYGTRADFHQMNALKEVSQELFGDNCIQFAFWDVDSADWVVDMTAQTVAQTLKAHYTGGLYYDFESYRDRQGRLQYRKVAKQMTNPPKGGVILQHDIHQKNIEGTRLYIEYAKLAGLQLVTLPEIEEFAVTKDCRFVE